MGSPRFKLFLSDVIPIAKEVGEKILAFATVTALAALASDQFLATVKNNFGELAVVMVTSLLGYVTSKRAVKDNTKG